MKCNQMELSFSSVSQNESFARAVAAAFAAQLNPTIAELTDIRTAVSEAVTNAIIHGYRCSPEKSVRMRMRIDGNEVHITIEDEGCGIADVELARQPFYTTVRSLERSGMGFCVMEAFMDELSVESKEGEGTRIHMLKRIAAERCDE